MRLVTNGVAVATFLLYAAAALIAAHERPTVIRVILLPLFLLLLSLPPHFVAWSVPSTGVDLIFYTFVMIAATIALIFRLLCSFRKLPPARLIPYRRFRGVRCMCRQSRRSCRRGPKDSQYSACLIGKREERVRP
jgi:hypothetical protein